MFVTRSSLVVILRWLIRRTPLRSIPILSSYEVIVTRAIPDEKPFLVISGLTLLSAAIRFLDHEARTGKISAEERVGLYSTVNVSGTLLLSLLDYLFELNSQNGALVADVNKAEFQRWSESARQRYTGSI